MTTLAREGTSAKVLDVPAGLRDSVIELESPVLVLTLLRMLGCLLEDAFELLLLLLVVVLVDFFSRVANECNANAGDIDILYAKGKKKRAKEKGIPSLGTETDKFDSFFFPNMNVR